MSTGQRYRWVKRSASTYQLTNASGAPLLLPNGSNTLVLTGGTVFGTISQLLANSLPLMPLCALYNHQRTRYGARCNGEHHAGQWCTIQCDNYLSCNWVGQVT